MNGRIVAITPSSGRYVNQPGTACSAGQQPVANDVTAGAVDDGNTACISITSRVRRSEPAGSRSIRFMPRPSAITKTTCSARPMASRIRRAGGERTTSATPHVEAMARERSTEFGTPASGRTRAPDSNHASRRSTSLIYSGAPFIPISPLTNCTSPRCSAVWPIAKNANASAFVITSKLGYTPVKNGSFTSIAASSSLILSR